MWRYFGNGITCKSSADCDIKTEVCSRYQAIDQQICIPKRHINEPCDVHATCYDNNSECRYSGYTGTCQCLHDYKEIDGQCGKIGLTLWESCVKEDQCSGTKYASRCLQNQTTETNVCSCLKDYIASGSNCIKGGLSLNETCEVDQQCSGKEKANTCSNYGKSQPTCSCNYGYIEKQSRCYRINLHLFVSCDWSEQCTGSHGANECKVVEGQRICYCTDRKRILEGACFKGKNRRNVNVQ
nr:protein disulfide isomerase CRELD1-like [Crassostrea gigas]